MGALLVHRPAEVNAEAIVWLDQFGTSLGTLGGDAVAVDATGVYVAGLVWGALPGQVSAGDADAFVRKYDLSGNILWTRQFGTPGGDWAQGLAIHAGGVYVTGSNGGASTGFIRKYDTNGNLLWADGPFPNGFFPNSVAADATGVYMAGSTCCFLGFVHKYSHDGILQWTRQFEGHSVVSAVAAADESGPYLAGYTATSLSGQIYNGGFDAFVRKYDAGGIEQWTRQFGTPGHDLAWSLTKDASGLYVSGSTSGTLPGQSYAGGTTDAFVRKYETDGTEGWTYQFGTDTEDVVRGVAVDASGVYATGVVFGGGTFPGQVSHGATYDGFLARIELTGAPAWTRQFGTVGADVPFAIAADVDGVYIAGRLEGVGAVFPEKTRSEGGTDVFLAKFDKLANALPIAVPDAASTTMNQSLVIDVLSNDSDSDDTYQRDYYSDGSLAVFSLTSPANGRATINADGTVAYSPDCGFRGSDTFTYTLSDAAGGAATAAVTITVEPGPPAESGRPSGSRPPCQPPR